MKATKSRISIDSSFLGGCAGLLLPPFSSSGIQRDSVRTCDLPDRIESAGMEGMAPRQPAQAHPHASRRAVTLDGFTHVFRTGRMEAAGRGQQRRDTKLVYAKKPGYDPLHRRKSLST